MKKIFLLIIISFTAITISRAQAGWLKVQVDKHLFINVPAQPSQVNRGLMAQGKDGLICIVGNVETSDSTKLSKLILSGDFATNLKSSMLWDMTGVSFGNVKTTKWHGYYFFTVDGENYSNNLMAFYRFLVIGGNVYTFGAMLPEGHSEKDKDAYFASLSEK